MEATSREARLAGERHDGVRVVARDDLDADAGVGERREDVAPASARSSSAMATRPRARMPGGQRRVGLVVVRAAGRRRRRAWRPAGPAARARSSAAAAASSAAQPAGSPSSSVAREGRRNVGAPRAMIPGSAGSRVRRTRPRSTCGPTRTAPRRPGAADRAASGRRSPRWSGCGRSPTRRAPPARRPPRPRRRRRARPPPRPRAGSRSACRSCRGTGRRRGSATRSSSPAGRARRSAGSGSRPGRRPRRSTRTGRWARGRRAASRRRRRRPGPHACTTPRRTSRISR